MKYKYNEDELVQEFQKYVESTYNSHYTSDRTNIQAVDIWYSLGSLESTCRDNALKYLLRFGKKDGKNKKDLLKAMHYILLMMYTLERGEKNAAAS